jgi:hypothetical protein
LKPEIKEDEISRTCSTKREKGMYTGFLVGKPEGRNSLRRPGHRWVINIKIDLREMRRAMWTGFIWLRIRDQWRAFVNTVMSLRVP